MQQTNKKFRFIHDNVASSPSIDFEIDGLEVHFWCCPYDISKCSECSFEEEVPVKRESCPECGATLIHHKIPSENDPDYQFYNELTSKVETLRVMFSKRLSDSILDDGGILKAFEVIEDFPSVRKDQLMVQMMKLMMRHRIAQGSFHSSIRTEIQQKTDSVKETSAKIIGDKLDAVVKDLNLLKNRIGSLENQDDEQIRTAINNRVAEVVGGIESIKDIVEVVVKKTFGVENLDEYRTETLFDDIITAINKLIRLAYCDSHFEFAKLKAEKEYDYDITNAYSVKDFLPQLPLV